MIAVISANPCTKVILKPPAANTAVKSVPTEPINPVVIERNAACQYRRLKDVNLISSIVAKGMSGANAAQATKAMNVSSTADKEPVYPSTKKVEKLTHPTAINKAIEKSGISDIENRDERKGSGKLNSKILVILYWTTSGPVKKVWRPHLAAAKASNAARDFRVFQVGFGGVTVPIPWISEFLV